MEMSEFDRHALIAMGSDVGILAEAKRTSSLEECFAVLSKLCPKYWIYKGGHHVAIHRETGLSDKGMRLALFTVA